MLLSFFTLTPATPPQPQRLHHEPIRTLIFARHFQKNLLAPSQPNNVLTGTDQEDALNRNSNVSTRLPRAHHAAVCILFFGREL